MVISNIQKSFEKGSDWIIDSVIDHNNSILKLLLVIQYNCFQIKDYSLAGSSYIELPKELNHQRKGLINIQNIDDNGCFKWCLIR